MQYNLVSKVSDLIYNYDPHNLRQLEETIDDRHGGDVLAYLDELIEEYLYNIDSKEDLQQYLVYLDNKMRYFTVECKHYALEKLFENIKIEL